MQMSGRPRQHRTGDAKVIVLPARAAIDCSGVTKLDFQIGKLFVGAAHRRFVGKADLIGP
jgi:hypothetical protein